MSIVTLKRKTQAKYNNVSTGVAAFSLNGTHRSQGWVGQTMLSRSLPRTPMKCDTPRGHGGCCGSYNKSHGIIQSGVVSLNNINVVKPSVIDNKGMLEEKLTPYHNYIRVKPDSNLNSNNMGEYIENRSSKNIVITDNQDCRNNISEPSCCKIYDPYFRSKLNNKHVYVIYNKTPSDYIQSKKGNTFNCENTYFINQPTYVQKDTNEGVLPGPPRSY